MDNNRITSLCCIMESLMQPSRGFNYSDKNEEHVSDVLNSILTVMC